MPCYAAQGQRDVQAISNQFRTLSNLSTAPLAKGLPHETSGKAPLGLARDMWHQLSLMKSCGPGGPRSCVLSLQLSVTL